jgi:hypothetical protein
MSNTSRMAAILLRRNMAYVYFMSLPIFMIDVARFPASLHRSIWRTLHQARSDAAQCLA